MELKTLVDGFLRATKGTCDQTGAVNMDDAFQLSAAIRSFEVKDIEGGVLNVGESCSVAPQQLDLDSGGTAMSDIGPTSFATYGAQPYPPTLEALVAQVQWLSLRVAQLESSLHAHNSFSQLRRVQFKVDRLYVKELSGTLNLGVSSIGGVGTVPPYAHTRQATSGLRAYGQAGLAPSADWKVHHNPDEDSPHDTKHHFPDDLL